MFMNNFWYGVVEDRMDPLMLGRLRVRIFGIHSPLKVAAETEGSPTENLLWCYPLQPINSAAISGIGISPTGPVEGTNVVGFFRDHMCQDAVILGTVGGYPVDQPNPSVGFNDPNGQYPRYTNAPDTNILARGGVTPSLPYSPSSSSPPPTRTEVPVVVEEQNSNRDVAIEPDNTPSEDIQPDPNPDMTIEEMLRRDEGVKVALYWDHLGYPTIGVGHLVIYEKTKDRNRIYALLSQQVGRKVTDGRITQEEVSKLFAGDVAKVRSDIARNGKVGPVYAKLDSARKMAIENMTFQMGIGGVANFNKALFHMAREEWADAQREMLDSAWAKQTPSRANRVSRIILNGNLSSYGVPPKSRAAMYSGSTPMFEEPESAYGAKYPFNHVYESESGHIQEFDDTPGAERYHRKHPSGTFEEISGGRRVVKIVGDDYLIVKSDRNVHISGNLNVVVDGNAKMYVMGNLDQTVDGSVTQFIRGDVTETIEGAVTQTINGDVTQHVKSNVNADIDGNYALHVKGNYDVTVDGAKTDNVTGSWTRKADTVEDTASGKFKATGAGAYLELNSDATLSGSTINLN